MHQMCRLQLLAQKVGVVAAAGEIQAAAGCCTCVYLCLHAAEVHSARNAIAFAISTY
jgi:hypothetical protein